MALETGTYLSDLVVSNPTASDGVGQGDDHLRLVKSTLKNTFAGFTTAVALASTQAQLDAAVGSTVSGTVSQVIKPGTAAAPGIGFLGDLTTGVYRPSAGQVGIAVGGVASIVAQASGVAITGALSATGTVSATGAYSGGTGQLVPIGAELIWNEDTLPAEGGYCWANGGTLSRAAYPILWGRWGTKYGAGDGSTTFNVPNHCEVALVGQRAMGAAASRSLLATGVLGAVPIGEANHLLLTSEMPSHFHTAGISDPGHAHSYLSPNSTPGETGGGSFAATTGGTANTTGTVATGVRVNSGNGLDTTNSQGGGAVHNNVQPSTAVNFIIRVG